MAYLRPVPQTAPLLRLEAEVFLRDIGPLPLLDIRSPAEFAAGHIPSAHSFPLFSNEERAEVGTLYKQVGRKAAVKKGLEIVGPKMGAFIEQAEALCSERFALYCWRGGMRSESMAWLLNQYGFGCTVLDGGYKAYRGALMRYFRKPLPLRVVSGYTGSKKTAFLHMLADQGAQVIDLEGLAGHQGSSFGNKKSTGQPTTEHFQNMVFEAFRNLDRQCPIWIEDEDMRIGTVNIVEPLFRQMSQSPHYVLDVPVADRVQFLVEDYGTLHEGQLVDATRRIGRRLGGEKTAAAIAFIETGDLAAAAAIILTYYDQRYQRALALKDKLVAARFTCNMADLPALARELAQQKSNVS